VFLDWKGKSSRATLGQGIVRRSKRWSVVQGKRPSLLGPLGCLGNALRFTAGTVYGLEQLDCVCHFCGVSRGSGFVAEGEFVLFVESPIDGRLQNTEVILRT